MPRRTHSIEGVFRALGDPTRRAIVERLGAGPATVSTLAAALCITVTAVGQHLHILEQSGLAITEKAGRIRTCRIDPRGFTVLETWMAHQRSMWERRLDRLGQLLEEDGD